MIKLWKNGGEGAALTLKESEERNDRMNVIWKRNTGGRRK
jgi:hypothetical protein